MDELLAVLKAFDVQEEVHKITLFGSGHINDTYKVDVTEKCYLLQRINSGVFFRPEIIEENLKILLDCKHTLFVRHYRTPAGHIHFINDAGIWRLTDFISEAYSPETTTSATQVAEVARGFGNFIARTDPLSVEGFREPIPCFHDLNKRLAAFSEAIKTASETRLEASQLLIEKVKKFSRIAAQFQELVAQGLPQRVCHNDTKLNNCLLSEADDRFQYVIDLDTVGPGYVLFDFGDLVRTTVSAAAENERDETQINLNPAYYTALEEGFIEGCREVLLPIELKNLRFGGLYMTYIIAVRFLTDYLNGDVYYKVSFENENHIRARNQLRLLEILEDCS